MPLKLAKLINISTPTSDIAIKYCDTFLSKFLGLMFKKELTPEHGIVLVENRESKINTSIHMLFMMFDITVLWLDKEMVIVDKVLAKKWRPVYFPNIPAQFVVELHQSKYNDYAMGDQLLIADIE